MIHVRARNIYALGGVFGGTPPKPGRPDAEAPFQFDPTTMSGGTTSTSALLGLATASAAGAALAGVLWTRSLQHPAGFEVRIGWRSFRDLQGGIQTAGGATVGQSSPSNAHGGPRGFHLDGDSNAVAIPRTLGLA